MWLPCRKGTGMSRVRGRSFPITKNQARGYGYAKARRMTSNPGVTTIAAINGRGSYAASRSARSVMSSVTPNGRKKVARRRLTAAQKAAFKVRMAGGKRKSHTANRSTSSSQSAASKRNIKKAQRSRKAWGRKIPRGKRVRVGRAAFGRKPRARKLKAGVYIANRRKKAGSKTTMARRRKRAAKPSTKRRSSKRRRKSTKKTTSAAPKRRRRKARKGAARRKTVAKKTVRRKRRRSAKKLTANRRRRVKRAAAPKRRRSRKAKSAAPKRRRRKARKSTTSRKRRVSRRRKTTSRKRRSSGRKKLTANRRRRHRRNSGKKLSSNRRRRSHRKNKGHKKNRRNGRRLFKMNGVGDVLKVGAVLFGGFALHRVLSNIFANQVLARVLPAPAAPAATSGFDLSGQKSLIASLLMGAGAGFIASKVIKNQETKKLVIGGIVMSTIQGVVLSLLKAFMPTAADALAGPEDGTAARLSAMYGLGAGASIMPRYSAIGEYFREPGVSGLGEYFREPGVSGLGEYISATSGLGTYENNGDLYQAAAGMGNHEYNGNHIDPSGDLDRQLNIVEAAAGVGALSPFEAAAGIGPMQAAAGMRGFGAIDTVPSGDTWIPGSTEGQLWAGVRAITAGQSASEMTPAGILQTDGGSGVFG